METFKINDARETTDMCEVGAMCHDRQVEGMYVAWCGRVCAPRLAREEERDRETERNRQKQRALRLRSSARPPSARGRGGWGGRRERQRQKD
jgi:hypothetical protein